MTLPWMTERIQLRAIASSTREVARRLGVSDTTMHKAERTGRIAREPDGQWDIAKTHARLLDTADPQRSALDESKGRLLDVATANATIDEIASTMRDALLNWPARVTISSVTRRQ
jgi:DNA-binding XRE family transcriptional regulator